MEIEPAARIRAVRPSPTVALTARIAALRAAGREVISLGAGEPDFDTPEHVRQAAREGIERGFTHYTVVDGIAELKAAIAAKLERDNRLCYQPEQILVSCGAKHSLYNLCQALLEPGDEAIVPAPYWVSYPEMVRLAGARPVIVPATLDEGFRLSPERLEAAITPATRLLFLNSPCNPTGVCYRAAELAALGEVLEAHPRVVVASDDIYEHIRWTGEPFANLVNARPALYPRTVVVNGVSKAYAMTGWRIGYAAGPAELIAAMRTVQSQATTSPNSIAQLAAAAALAGDQRCVAEMRAVFRERHARVLAALGGLPGVRCLPAEGAFYAFPEVLEAITRIDGVSDDVGLAEHLLERAGVAVVPGSAFGAPGHLRLSFATATPELERALELIAGVLGR